MDGLDSYARSVTLFFDTWLASLASETTYEKAMKCFRLLMSGPFSNRKERRQWQSGLCSDGTPLEFTLSVTSDPSVSFGFGCDTYTSLLEMERRTDHFTTVTSSLLHELGVLGSSDIAHVTKNLVNLPKSSRFVMWHGIRITIPDEITGKLYLNTNGMDREDIVHVVETSSSRTLMPELCSVTGSAAFLGMDVDTEGIKRIKIYTRAPTLQELKMIASGTVEPEMLHNAFEAASDTLRLHVSSRTDSLMMSLGFKPETEYISDITIFCPAEKSGLKTMKQLANRLGILFSKWKLGAPSATMSSVKFLHKGFHPTVISVGASSKSFKTTAYFKPAGWFA